MLKSPKRQKYKYCVLQDPDQPFPVIKNIYKKAQTFLSSHIPVSYLGFPVLQHLTSIQV